MRALKKSIHIVLLLLVVLSLPLTAFAAETGDGSDDETDLQISVETITQRQYSGTAVTDSYGIEILTEDGYSQAQEIAATQKRNNQAAQAALFSAPNADKQNTDVTAITEELKMFDSSYTISAVKTTTNANASDTYLTVLVLLIAVGVGILIAVVWQKRKGRQAS